MQFLKSCFLAGWLLCFSPGTGLAESGISSEGPYRPTKVPDRIILTWAGDPSTTQAVTWRTDKSVSRAAVELAEAEDGPYFVTKKRSISAVTEFLRVKDVEANYHSVQMTGLKPDTFYCYRVGDGANWSEWNQFRTASAKADPLTFLFVGDAQNSIMDFWSRLMRQAIMTAPDARFIVHAGDLIKSVNADDEWGEWHKAPGWINQSIPSVPSPGNHEYGILKSIDVHWRPQFTLPENGLPGLKESSYWLDIQGVRVISLNCVERQEEQAAWLDEVLKNNPNRWTVLTFHYPVYSAGKGRDNLRLRNLWQPIFDKYSVDLVLTGHDHNYARSDLLTGPTVPKRKAGTVYVVSVSGPKMGAITDKKWWTRAGEDTQLFQVIRIAGDKMVYESRTARGVLYDAFELRHEKGGSKRLVNRVPRTPETLRSTTGEPPFRWLDLMK